MENNSLITQTVLTYSSTGHAETTSMLIDAGVKVVICGGIGSAAMGMLMEEDVLVIPGMQGDIMVAVASYLDGTIETIGQATCGHHHGEHEGHSCSDGGCSCGSCH